ncbi:SDR family oxidoreductase [Sinosporangium siamense]|uniref:Uncharacterized protein n=1 Tax=Sinosporangium siamense TaxID=1367973 RepID=A0A919RP12_9ACTN|nr:SDR family oxidoreductase [Sinosporangium siamense]GII97297.1 hypothetical protein Ssi02_75280 [Sinosporangium siamense]
MVGTAVAVRADLADRAGVDHLLEEAGRRLDALDILVNNAVGPIAGGKAAMEVFSVVAAGELGVRGITVNVVSPGATDTDLLRETNPEATLEVLVGMTPLGRLGLPDDIADVVAFLAGPDSRWVTGQNIRATGGLGYLR